MTEHTDDPLSWLSRILWPDGSTRLMPPTAGHDGGIPAWWAWPSLDEPRILIPADLGPGARAAVARYHDGMSLGLRGRSLAAEVLMTAAPIAGRALKGRLVAPVSTGQQPATSENVLGGLAEMTGVPDLRVAIGLSVPKTNRKPVLQLLTPDGGCLGWAKVGWNRWTERLVGNEAAWLVRRTDEPLTTPALLHDRRVAGHRIVVSGHVPTRRLPSSAVGRAPAPEVFAAVAGMGSGNGRGGLTEPVPLKSTGWCRSVQQVLPWADERERAAILAVSKASTDLRLPVGGFHGDLTPWNLISDRTTIRLIDWEFAADEVPYGFDLCHFHTQVGAELRGLSADLALDRSARLSPGGLADLGIDPGLRAPIWPLYLVELIRRTLALRADGHETAAVTFGPAAVRRLERSLRLPGPAGSSPSGPTPHRSTRHDAGAERTRPEPATAGPTAVGAILNGSMEVG